MVSSKDRVTGGSGSFDARTQARQTATEHTKRSTRPREGQAGGHSHRGERVGDEAPNVAASKTKRLFRRRSHQSSMLGQRDILSGPKPVRRRAIAAAPYRPRAGRTGASCYPIRSIMDWWLTQAGRVPIGPVSTELLLKGIGAGKVPGDVLVCEVGGTQWRRVSDVTPFRAALTERSSKRRFDPESERTVLDPRSFPPSEPAPRPETIPVPRAKTPATRAPATHRPLRPEPSSAAGVHRVEDTDEDDKTIVDAFPPLPSEPPSLPPWKRKRPR
jgi:hypothetical protein